MKWMEQEGDKGVGEIKRNEKALKKYKIWR